MKNLNPIHFNEAQNQANETAKTTQAVDNLGGVLGDTLKEVSKGKATSQDIQQVSTKLDNLVEITKSKNSNDIVNKLEEVINTIKSIPITIIPEPKEFPTFPEFPEIKPTDMSETNKLLQALLDKEEKEIPPFPEIPESKEPDFTATNKLLQQLIDKEDKEMEIAVTLNIV